MSWLPFPALRFLPLGLYLWYREPHQPVQHQRNTSATCCTHLHPPEGAPVCGGRDQHQRSKYHPCHHCRTLGPAEQHTPAAPTRATPQLLLIWVHFIPRTLPHPSREPESCERETCFSFFCYGIEAFSALLRWILVVFLLPQPTNPGCTGSCRKQEKVPVFTVLHFQGYGRIWQEKPEA